MLTWIRFSQEAQQIIDSYQKRNFIKVKWVTEKRSGQSVKERLRAEVDNQRSFVFMYQFTASRFRRTPTYQRSFIIYTQGVLLTK